MTIIKWRSHGGLDQEGDGGCEVGRLYFRPLPMTLADGFHMEHEKRRAVSYELEVLA